MKASILFLLAILTSLSVFGQDTIRDTSAQQMVTYYTPSADTVSGQPSAIYSDTIVTTAGESVVCRITEVSPEMIYFAVDSLPDLTCVITTSSVFMLKYSNGTHDLGSDLIIPDYYAMGREDGHKYYKSREAFAGTFVSGLAFWVLGAGILSGAIITAVPPKKIHNQENPNDHLLNTNQDYYDGYMKSARKKKVLHSTGGFFAGVGTLVGVVVIIAVSAW